MAEKEKKQDKIEKEYVIPLREKCRPVPRYKKTNKAVKSVKEFLVRHMKIRDRNLNKIKLDIHLNEFLWARGIKNPPHKVKVKVVKVGDIVSVELVDYPDKLKFKKLRLEKRELNAKSSLEKNKTLMEKARLGTKSPASSTEASSNERKGIAKKPEETKTSDEEKKEDEQEKKSAVVEEGEKISKEEAKDLKKTTKVKSPEQIQDAIKEPQAK